MTSPSPARRRHDLDALRGFAMLLGIGLHAALAFFPTFWPAQDDTGNIDAWYDEFFHAIHGFRMPLFFLLSGFFTAMMWRRRGLRSLLGQRVRRIGLPLLIGLVTIVPLVDWASERATSDDLVRAAFGGNAAAVENLLEDGVDPDEERGPTGETALHAAAVVDDAAVAELLLEAGASRLATDDNRTPVFDYAFFFGSEAVADVLVAYGQFDPRPQGTGWSDLPGWAFGAELSEELGLDSWTIDFAHLWFLWFLVWLVAGFAIVALVVQRLAPSGSGAWPRRVMWALVPLTLIPQLAMGDGGDFPVFGPDTSAELVPIPHVLVYYAVFFAFGALLHDRGNRRGELYIDTLGRWWKFALPLTLVVVFPVALDLTFDDGSWLRASVAQVIFAWAMIVGLMGLFRAALGVERRGVRYLSDSSYWLYLAHLPLVIFVQAWITDWELPSLVKFTGLTAAATILLLASYQLAVRYTPIGTLLNGKRTRPRHTAGTPAG